MDPVGGISATSSRIPDAPSGSGALASFSAKVAASGDLASECMAIMAEDNACQASASLHGIRVWQRAVRQARRRRLELLKKQWAASRKRGFWDKLGGIFSKIAKAVGALMALCCPPAGGLLFGGAAAVAAGCGIAGGHYQRTAAKVAADAVSTEQYKQVAQEARDDTMRALQDAAEVEKRMVRRITILAESESRSVVME